MSVSHLKWQVHDERRARPGPAVDAHGAAKLFDDAADDEESEAQPVRLTVPDDALERLEDPSVELGSDPQAAVGHLEAGTEALAVGARPNDDRAPLSVLDGVGNQVGDDLIEARPIPTADDRSLQLHLQLRSRAGGLHLH